jgi:hypothetical protein
VAGLVAPLDGTAQRAPAAPAASPAATGIAAGADAPATPGEQAPQATRRRAAPVTKTAPTRRLRAGDLVCGECGEGNPATRKFCSRCGNSLLESETVKTPWWKKLLPRRGPKVVATSDGAGRPGHAGAAGLDLKHRFRKVYRRVRIVVGIAVVIAGAAYLVLPPVHNAVNSRFTNAKNHVEQFAHPSYVPVRPVSVKASLQKAGHPGRLAVDLFTNTYWLAPWNPAHEPTLTLKFSHKVILREIILHSGASGNYVGHGRPDALHLVFSNGNSDTIRPQDTSSPQTLHVSHAIGVTSVEIQVAGVYQGNSGSDVAITEIELFALQP